MSQVSVTAFVSLEGLFRLTYELEQSWESPLNKMMKLHNNDLTHKQPGSCIIFTQWPLCNSSVKPVPS